MAVSRENRPLIVQRARAPDPSSLTRAPSDYRVGMGRFFATALELPPRPRSVSRGSTTGLPLVQVVQPEIGLVGTAASGPRSRAVSSGRPPPRSGAFRK